jgi:hypothetical protein
MLWVAMNTTTRGFLPPGENVCCSAISAATQRPGPGADDVVTLILIAPTMGQADLYPVVLSESGIGKLAFIHDLLDLGATSLS